VTLDLFLVRVCALVQFLVRNVNRCSQQLNELLTTVRRAVKLFHSVSIQETIPVILKVVCDALNVQNLELDHVFNLFEFNEQCFCLMTLHTETVPAG